MSKGHIPLNSENQQVPARDPSICTIYRGGSRVDFPGVESQDPRVQNPAKRRHTPRGKVLNFSAESRRRLVLLMGTILKEAPAWTIALTCPGELEGITPEFTKRQFLRLMDAVSRDRNESIRALGLLWKQEFQERGALHFHLLLYGVSEEQARAVQAWFARRWNALLCVNSSPEEREKHLWWHLRDGWEKRRGHRLPAYQEREDNMQRVRKFSGYFAKYLGKDEGAGDLSEPVPGRWWGVVNRDSVPWAEKVEIPSPARVRVHAHRIARKLRQVRADQAKHAAISAQLEERGLPRVSLFYVTCGHRQRDRLSPLIYREISRHCGLRFGRYRFPPSFRYSPVKLTGEHIPDLAVRILHYAGQRAREDLENRPF